MQVLCGLQGLFLLFNCQTSASVYFAGALYIIVFLQSFKHRSVTSYLTVHHFCDI